jgi:hypothetical protein
MTDKEADRLFDSMLVKVEKKLERRLLVHFNKLSVLIREVIANGGIFDGNILILEQQVELAKILEEAYSQAIREGVIFTRRDLDLPQEEDEDNINEALLLLLLWRTNTASAHADLLTQTTLKLYNQFSLEADALGLTGIDKDTFISRELLKRNRGRIANIATTESGEAISAGSGAQAQILTTPDIAVGATAYTIINQRELRKFWRSQRDRRVRDTHRIADQRYTASPIGLHENFQVGLSSGPYPRASQLSMEERNGCRCYVRYKGYDI